MIYDLNRKAALKIVDAFLDKVGVIRVGRYAEWKYAMTHDCGYAEWKYAMTHDCVLKAKYEASKL